MFKKQFWGSKSANTWQASLMIGNMIISTMSCSLTAKGLLLGMMLASSCDCFTNCIISGAGSVISAADGLEVWAGRELNLDQILD